MTFITVEQALYGAFDGGGYRFVARSPGFREEWISEAERICAGFGERPAGVACPAAVFAQPLGRHHVAIRAGKGKKLEWDGPNMKVTNWSDAERLVKGEYRKGWELS